jgi:hypothetical protein
VRYFNLVLQVLLFVDLKVYQHDTCSAFLFREMVEVRWCVNRMASGTRLESLASALGVVVTTLLGCIQGCPCMNSGLQALYYATRTDSNVSEITNSNKLETYS